ncbi:FecR family protein [Bradyrhizobium sp.]|uniref:FecR family protein n=1 Tax=Bradyrhizobium sp. TaxID=376 RepID=UPI003418A41E
MRALVTALALTVASPLFAADGGIWSVSKSSGEVWFTSGDVQQASLKPEQNLKPGDTIRTGRNGRVLLVRGEESVLIAPNSVVGLPVEATAGLSTTIVQRAGSILLEVEKRNVKHFEVETPYLAAVVKGTRFRVTVNSSNTSVDVIRGQVEVDDFKSGQIAEIMPGQRATAFEHGKSGLVLSGAGTFNLIEQGKPRPSTLERVPVPKNGLSAPRNAANKPPTHTLAALDHSVSKPGMTGLLHGGGAASHAGLHLSAPLGDVKLNFQRVTHGLARGTAQANGAGHHNNTVWSPSGSSSGTINAAGNGNDAGSASAANNSASGSSANASSVTAAVAAATSSGSNHGNGNGNANGNGNGNGNENGNGNGNGNGHGNGHGNH